MNEQACFIGGCTQILYAPTGTRGLCKEHFLNFVKWRRRKGGIPLFRKYGAMTMQERDPTVDEWAQTVTVSST
jgi:hypothetical protein